MVLKKEKRFKKNQGFCDEFDNSIAYDISKYFSKLTIKNSKCISFDSEFYQNEIFQSKEYTDEKLKKNKNFFNVLVQVIKFKLKHKK